MVGVAGLGVMIEDGAGRVDNRDTLRVFKDIREQSVLRVGPQIFGRRSA